VGGWERAGKWVRRRPALAGLLGVGLAALLTLLGVWTFFTARLRAERDLAQRQERIARRYLYASDIDRAQQAWETPNVGRMVRLLERHRPQPGEEDLRGFEWYYLWRLCHGERLTLSAGAQAQGASPRGPPNPRRSAGAPGDGPAPQSPPNPRLAFSPDGQTLATAAESVMLWDVATGAVRHRLVGVPEGITSIAFTADGGTLVTATWLEVRPPGPASRSPGAVVVQFWDPKTGTESASSWQVEAARPAALSDGARLLAMAEPTDSATEFARLTVWDVKYRTRRDIRIPGSGKVPDQLPAVVWGRGEDLIGVKEITDTGPPGAFRPPGFGAGPPPGPGPPPRGRIGRGPPPGSNGMPNPLEREFSLVVWDLRTNRRVATLGGVCPEDLRPAFSPDGRMAATGTRDRMVVLWDLATGERRATLPGHTGWVFALAFSPDGRRLASGSTDGTVRLWDARTGREQAVFKGHLDPVGCVAFTPDGRTVVGFDFPAGSVKFWDPDRVPGWPVTFGSESGDVWRLAIAPDGAGVVLGRKDGGLELWDLPRRSRRATWKGVDGLIRCLAYAPDGQTVAVGWGDPGDPGAAGGWQLRDAQTGAVRSEARGKGLSVLYLAFSPDGGLLATAATGTVTVWEVGTGRQRATLGGRTDHVECLAFAPDGTALAGGDAAGAVTVWDVAGGRVLASLQKHAGMVNGLMFQAGGRQLVSADGDGKILVWEWATGAEAQQYQAHERGAMARFVFSPGAKRTASFSELPDKQGQIVIWDPATWQELLTLKGPVGLWDLAFSADGGSLVAVGRDGKVQVWDGTPPGRE
jgi:WD40 repeat protein